MVEVGLVSPPARVVLAVGRDNDEQDILPELGTQPPCEFVAVDAGQADIEQCYIRSEGPGDFQGLESVEGDFYLMPLIPQEPRATHGKVLVVVDDEHTTLARTL